MEGLIFGILRYLPAVEGRDWVVRDKTYNMQLTVKITSNYVALVYHVFLFDLSGFFLTR